MTNFSNLIGGGIMAAALAISVPAMAGDNSKLVQYNDLDLSSEAGQQRFHTRVKSAVKQVCSSPRAFSLAEKQDVQRCVKNAMAQAMPKAAETIANYQESKRLASNETSAIVGN